MPQVARPSEAEVSAPISAPAPKHAVSSPKTWAPAWRVSLATRGISTVKLMLAMQMKANMPSAMRSMGVRRTKRNPSAVPRKQRNLAARRVRDGVEFVDVHEQQRDDDRNVADGVDGEADADAEGRDQDAADAGAKDTRGVGQTRIEGDGVGQLVTPHHLEDEGLPGGIVHNQGEATDSGDGVGIPDGDDARERERPP